MTKNTILPALGVLLLICCVPSLAQVQVISNGVWDTPTWSDVSAPLISLPMQKPTVSRPHGPLKPKAHSWPAGSGKGPVAASGGFGPAIGLTFEGVSGDPGSASSINCPNVSGAQVEPPDTNAAVGDTQIVQWVNLCFSIYDKATGALIAGPFPGNHFWAGAASLCATTNDGDPIIQFDKVNHVWLASQNTFGPYGSCIAVSTTNDATGSYNRYFYTQPGFPDYPKWGLTSSIYFQNQNDFGTGAGYVGVNVCAYDAAALRAGPRKKIPKRVCLLDNSGGTLFDDSFLPADNDSGTPGSEVFLGSIDNVNPGTNVYEYVMTVNFKGKGSATLSGTNGTMPIAVPQYSLACGGFGACIPQPSPGSELLDSLGDRLMYRLAVFDDGTTAHYLVTHSVNDTAATAARWYEFTAPHGSTSLALAQSGQTPDDAEYRWMGSIARDKFGDIALGYSRSSAAAGDYPSIYISGQTAGEPGGTTDAEVLAWQGGGSQTTTLGSFHRWGDYSSMALDLSDSCTFWYTTEYYPFDGDFAWYTHVAQVKFPSCP